MGGLLFLIALQYEWVRSDKFDPCLLRRTDNHVIWIGPISLKKGAGGVEQKSLCIYLF